MPQVQIIEATYPISHVGIKRVAAYVRVSSSSEDQLNSYAFQIMRYQEIEKEHDDWRLVDIYADEGITGTRLDKREEFNRLLQDCRQGKIDLIITKSVARFARNMADCLVTLRELKALGITVIFEADHINTDRIPNERLLVSKGSMAQNQSTSLSQSMRWSYQRRMATGEFISYKPATGWEIRDKGEFVVVEREKEVVQWINQAIQDGRGSMWIAKQLRKQGIAKKNGQTDWLPGMISYIAKNEKNIGCALLQKTYTPNTLPFIKKRNHGEVAQYYVQNAVPALLEKETFDLTQEVIKKRRSKFLRNDGEIVRYPLSGILKCGDCGNGLRRKSTSTGRASWVCRKHSEWGKEECGNQPVYEQEIYDAFIRTFNRLIKYREVLLIPMLEQLEMIKEHVQGREKRAAKIYEKINDLSQQYSFLTMMHRKGNMYPLLYIESSQAIEDQIRRLRQERSQLLNHQENRETVELKALLNRIQDQKNGVMLRFDAELFQNTVDKILVWADGAIKICLKCGLELPEKIMRDARCQQIESPPMDIVLKRDKMKSIKKNVRY